MKSNITPIKASIAILVFALIFFGAGIYIKKEDKKYSEATLPLPTSTLPITTNPPASTSTIPVSNSGIIGTATIGPSCPVVTDPPQGQCADKPYATTFRLLRSDGTFVKNFSSDQNGNFKIIVDAGVYKIEDANPRANPGALPRMSPVDNIKVYPKNFTTVKIMFDSGIR